MPRFVIAGFAHLGAWIIVTWCFATRTPDAAEASAAPAPQAVVVPLPEAVLHLLEGGLDELQAHADAH